jgi:hypothetical protein
MARSPWRTGIAASVVVAVLSGGNPAAGAHRGSRVPDVGLSDSLGAVEASGAAVWAAGSYLGSRGTHPLVFRWNGTAWKRQRTPSAAGAGIAGLAASSTSDVWAVGSRISGGVPPTVHTFALHWDGGQWSTVKTPNRTTGSSAVNSLQGVTTTGPSSAWAVGFSGVFGSSSSNRTLVLHWDGRTWARQGSPNPGAGGDFLNGVTSVTPALGWAVGSEAGSDSVAHPLILVRHGTAWTKDAPPSLDQPATLHSVSATSTSAAWAVGISGKKVSHTLVFRWNGNGWSHVKSPEVGTRSNSLNAVDSIPAGHGRPSVAWAVGFAVVNGVERTLVLHWGGHSWVVQPSPNVGSGDNDLFGVRVVSASDVWAVGESLNQNGSQSRNVVLHWDGHSWSVA